MATIFRRSFKPWLIDYITALGILLFPVRHNVLVYITFFTDIVLPPVLNSLLVNGFWALIVGGVLAKKLLLREYKFLNVKVKVSRDPLKLVFLCSLSVALVYLLPVVSLTPLFLFVVFLICGVITWVVWNFTAVPITRMNIYGNIRGRDTGDRLVVKTNLPNSIESDVGFTEVFIKSVTPTLLSFSLLAFLSEFMPWLGVDISSFEVFTNLLKFIFLAFLVLIVVSPFVAPPSWILSQLDLRVYDKENEVIEEARINDILSSFVDIFAFIGLVVSFYQLGSSMLSRFLGNVRDISDIMIINLVATTTISAFTYFWLTLATPALLAITLYYKYSFTKHLRKILKGLKPVNVKVVVISQT